MTDERPEPAEFVVHGVGYCGGCATYSEAKEAQRINGGGTIYRAIDVHIGDRLLSLESDLAAALARAEAAEARVRNLKMALDDVRVLYEQRIAALIAAGDGLRKIMQDVHSWSPVGREVSAACNAWERAKGRGEVGEQIVQRALTFYDMMHAEIKKRDARIMALEAAARAVLPLLTPGGVCGECLYLDSHHDDCPVGALAALVGEVEGE